MFVFSFVLGRLFPKPKEVVGVASRMVIVSGWVVGGLDDLIGMLMHKPRRLSYERFENEARVLWMLKVYDLKTYGVEFEEDIVVVQGDEKVIDPETGEEIVRDRVVFSAHSDGLYGDYKSVDALINKFIEHAKKKLMKVSKVEVLS